ncbi:MAG TPA: sigma-70 family RNA polymerase sigma factor [Candidatus Methylomirabilis sp.]
MHGSDPRPAGPVDDPWGATRPGFLDLLDKDPDRAWAEFHAFAWRLLRAITPPAMRSLSSEERDDLIGDIVFFCGEYDFRILRRYQDMGTPFSAWLLRVAKHRALDRHRRLRTQLALAKPKTMDGHHPDTEDRLTHRQLLAGIRKCLSSLSAKCRLLLAAAADEMKPSEIATLLGPMGSNKQVSDDLRYCRRGLLRALANEGFEYPFPKQEQQ